MARPRSIPDQIVLDQALVLMRRAGPEGVSFAALTAEIGLSPATLVQRFGSKAGLLEATLAHAWSALEVRTAAEGATVTRNPAGAVAWLVALSGGYGDGDDYADGLLVLREDLIDPALRQRGVAWFETIATILGDCLGDAAGPRPDLGRLMVAQWQGAVLLAGFDRRRPVAETVEADLKAWCRAIGRQA
ncbi:TetR/AcrR family transcriptional regulator [Phreatobacter stygius]|nr:helix-turn-helix domain-containing protein [Phreatobacter stygius]